MVVANTSPSILPYIKVRENPHVTSDEWRWIITLGKKYNELVRYTVVALHFTSHRGIFTIIHFHIRPSYAPSPTTNFLTGEGEEGSYSLSDPLRPTEEQYAFGKILQKGLEKLFDYLEVKQRPEHRIYDSGKCCKQLVMALSEV